MKVNGKVILVTGAGNGMGREITLELIRRGAKVAAVDLREEFLTETKKEALALGGTIETFVVDVTDSAKVATLPANVIKKLGNVDAIINNAGIIQPFVKINDLSYEAATHVMNVNFNGPLHMVKSFLPELLKRPEAHILNVSSMGAYAPVPGQSVYGASKAAIKLFTEGLRSELLDTKVGVTIVFPGAIETNIAANSGMANPGGDAADAPKFKMTKPTDAAKAMVDAIENNKPRICIGQDAKMMDFLTRLNPVYAAGVIYKQMKSLLG
ncbi:MAG: SDR family NAD(P)-dependent oxidoreductase [Rhodoluna sp.]|nr:SDR family NAD(P)-dependent oxidoreductase [Rhodoluna sp.]